MTYYISLKRSWKDLFNANVFEKPWLKLYHQKPETIPWNIVRQRKLSNNEDILNIVEKFLKRSIQCYSFRKTLTETIPSKTSNMVYVKEIFFDNYDILYIVENVMEIAIQWQIYRKLLLVNYTVTNCKKKEIFPILQKHSAISRSWRNFPEIKRFIIGKGIFR